MYFSNDSKYTKLERTANEGKIILEDLKLEKKEENTVALPKPVQKSNIISKKIQKYWRKLFYQQRKQQLKKSLKKN